MVTVAGAVLAGIVLLAAAIKALPVIWSFAKAAAKAPIILEGVAAEFSPNGGGSMRDAINRIEHEHGVRLTKIEQSLAEVRAEQAAVALALDELG